jgi:hypothetical protein
MHIVLKIIANLQEVVVLFLKVLEVGERVIELVKSVICIFS